jgi:hypothetical protein
LTSHCPVKHISHNTVLYTWLITIAHSTQVVFYSQSAHYQNSQLWCCLITLCQFWQNTTTVITTTQWLFECPVVLLINNHI